MTPPAPDPKGVGEGGVRGKKVDTAFPYPDTYPFGVSGDPKGRGQGRRGKGKESMVKVDTALT